MGQMHPSFRIFFSGVLEQTVEICQMGFDVGGFPLYISHVRTFLRTLLSCREPVKKICPIVPHLPLLLAGAGRVAGSLALVAPDIPNEEGGGGGGADEAG